MTRCALYARVSTSDQSCAGQLEALREYAKRREFEATEYADEGISGSRADRAGFRALEEAVRKRRVDAVICTKLDRLFRNVRHLVLFADELRALKVDLIVLDQAVDTTTPAGRLTFHILGAMAEFERDLIRERVVTGVRRAQRRGTKSGRRIGRPRRHWIDQAVVRGLIQHMSLRAVARELGVPPSAVSRALTRAPDPMQDDLAENPSPGAGGRQMVGVWGGGDSNGSGQKSISVPVGT